MVMEITEKNNVLTIPTCGSIGKWRLVRGLRKVQTWKIKFKTIPGRNKENAGPFEGRSNKDCKHFYVQNTLRIFR